MCEHGITPRHQSWLAAFIGHMGCRRALSRGLLEDLERFTAQLMVALHRCGREVEALEDYRKAIILAPKDVEVLRAHAHLLVRRGKYVEAIEDSRQLQSLGQEPGDVADLVRQTEDVAEEGDAQQRHEREPRPQHGCQRAALWRRRRLALAHEQHERRRQHRHGDEGRRVIEDVGQVGRINDREDVVRARALEVADDVSAEQEVGQPDGEDGMRRFLSDRTRNRYNAQAKRLEISKIFDWYGKDFEKGHKGFSSVSDVAAKYADQLADAPDDRTQLPHSRHQASRRRVGARRRRRDGLRVYGAEDGR
jgi:tetratricopeptide (TPR) repeat protein